MIGYIQGTLLQQYEDRVLLLAGPIGYEILLPAFVMDTVKHRSTGDEVSFYIYHQQTERQPKPMLIGFNTEIEKEFFHYFISVEDIGPMKAVKALTIPIGEIARASESKDVASLKKLKGIGARTAQKVVATLSGKTGKFALMPERAEARPVPAGSEDVAKQVMDVLVDQLGYRVTDARRMVSEALERNPGAETPEELFEEVYRGEMAP
ncbi:MAG: Holliday junction DNA helicase RuvA [Desulfobacteraceae bacterium]|nr:Holliday junction DNA helicase RuvA [Desulfobacteraceae bacterium]